MATLRPGSRNIKPHALSSQFVSTESTSWPEPIPPASCVVPAVTWELEAKTREAQQVQTDSGNNPANRLCLILSG